jgi:hypothetical protein
MSPMSFDSSLASEIFDGARNRFGTDVGTTTSGSSISSLTSTSNIECLMARAST